MCSSAGEVCQSYLDNACAADGLGVAHVRPAEQELSREVAEFDRVHVGHGHLAVVADTHAHHREALEVLAAERAAPHQEDPLVGGAPLKVLAENGDLVVVPGVNGKEEAGSGRSVVGGERCA